MPMPNHETTLPADPTPPATGGPVSGVHLGPDPTLTVREEVQVDAREDLLMAEESVEGRPPSYHQRFAGRWWVVLAACVAVVGGAIWAWASGISAGSAAAGLGASAIFLLMGGWPVLNAVRLRLKEHRHARLQAISEVHHHG